ncbi:MAG: ureidoglycolate lyase [Stenomitos rutilans HA7619-LM2]|jgi:ureidoglycolate hydrolase|nr:ureidoglycolate lyase [Stenomitos rutilans HA7619-LM2]
MDSYLLKRAVVQQINPENFLPFGQMIAALDDHTPFSEKDAQLQIHKGIPRFYIMRLYQRGRKFHHITRHHFCTQCLGSLEGKDWLMGVAPPSLAKFPAWKDIVVFRIPGNCFIKLAVGTWHAGPFFDHDCVDFYNLELSDTNLVDHDTCNLLEQHGVAFEIVS